MDVKLKYPVALITEDDVSGYSSLDALRICYEDKLDNNKLPGAMIVDSKGRQFTVKNVTKLNSMDVHGRKMARVEYELSETGKMPSEELESLVLDTLKKKLGFEFSIIATGDSGVIDYAGVYWQMEGGAYLKYPVAIIIKNEICSFSCPGWFDIEMWNSNELIGARIVDVDGKQLIIKSVTDIESVNKLPLFMVSECAKMGCELAEADWLSLDEFKSLVIETARNWPSADRAVNIQQVKGAETHYDIIYMPAIDYGHSKD